MRADCTGGVAAAVGSGTGVKKSSNTIFKSWHVAGALAHFTGI